MSIIYSGLIMIFSIFIIALAGMTYNCKKTNTQGLGYKFSVGMIIVGVLSFVASVGLIAFKHGPEAAQQAQNFGIAYQQAMLKKP